MKPEMRQKPVSEPFEQKTRKIGQLIHPSAITAENIETYRGSLTLKNGDLPYDIWDVFERADYNATKNARIVKVNNLISSKNELLDQKLISGKKADPRQTAFEFMKSAASGLSRKRSPLKVYIGNRGAFHIMDGNATAQ